MAVPLALWGSLTLLTYEAKSELEVSASIQISAPGDFYQPLAADGSWVDVDGYGRCFHPASVDTGWRPYCEGDWVWTDCGWYWESDEPWGWACYHYGTWFQDPRVGWVWVPGIEWAPAWVTWRTGGDFVGWAPCAPRGVVVATGWFAFVGVNHFQDHIRRESISINNTTAISQTRVLAGPARENRSFDGRTQQVVINHGPDMQAIQKATGRQLKTVPIQDASRSEKGAPHNLGSADRKTDSANPKTPAAGNEKRPSNETKEQVVPNQNLNTQPQRSLDTRQPAVEHPVSTPKQNEVTPERPLPNQNPNLQPGKSSETRQPIIEHPVAPPKQGDDAPERAVPGRNSVTQPQRPTENTQPFIQHQQPSTQKPSAAPPREVRPANPPREEKPANPPQGQDKNQDKKDGLRTGPQMMASLSCNLPPTGRLLEVIS